ncbi:MAG: T9SS type A sorting domain-containing protein [Saprospiraceae bacterium]|nr:T9SS type A sorting domain-containing protein [Saprospiraceae bacterium]MBK9630667.1 T9SS type A sorting domain-containing protein [Saprospiraceae bacterium]
MKRLLLFSVFCTLVMGLSAQKVTLRINEPNDISGGLLFVPGSFGGDVAAGVVTAEAACSEPIQACTPLTNGAAISGKIALIDRGTCNFDQKCLNAQNAGAVAVIVMNHNDQANRGGTAFVMGGATPAIADQVTIPCVMISYADGVKLKAACTDGDIINITLGSVNKQDRDVSIYGRTTTILSNGSTFTQPIVFNPQYGAIPSKEIKNDGDFSFIPGAYFKNDGNLTLNNLDLSVTIKRGATDIYHDETNENISLEPDSISALLNNTFEFSSVDTNGRIGAYNISYNIGNEEADDIDIDNTHSTTIQITNNLLSKCRLDVNTKIPQIGSFVWGGQDGYREIMVPLNIRNGKGAVLDSIFSYVQAAAGTLAGSYFEGRVYKFTDINGDGIITSDELELVALGFNSFAPTFTGTSAILRLGLESLVGSSTIYTIEEDNTLFFATIRYEGGSGGMFFGYDMDFHQESYFLLKESLGQLEITDYPYLSSATKDATTDGPDMSAAGLFFVDANGSGAFDTLETAFFTPSIVLQITYPEEVNTKDISGDLDVQLELSPVPARDVLVASFSLDEASKVNYQIIAANGNLVLNQYDKVAAKDFRTTFNVSGLAAGTYFLKINTDKGYTKKAFVKVN